MSLAAVVLAAGASTRMGRPKALIEWRGRPFFMHCVQRAIAVGCEPVVVVWGATELPAATGALRVENPAWRQGPLSSLQTGLRAALSAGAAGVLVMTVDRPHVRVATLQALVDEHRASPDVVVQPRVGESSGHPVIHPRSVAQALLQLSPDGNARTVLGAPAIRAARVRVAVDDPAVLENLDTPEDLKRLGLA